MLQVLLVVHLIIAAAMIAIVLMQKSEGGALGIGGGGGAGGFLSGRGTANLLTRVTAGLALAFFCTSLGLSILASNSSTPRSRFEQPATNQPATTPESKPGETGSAPNLLDSLKKGEGFRALPSVPQNQ